MEQSEESDNEFWTSIEKIPSSEKQIMKSFTMKIADVIKEKIESTSIVKPMFSQQKPGNSLINKEYYEDKLARVRESKNEELQQYAIITKNHFRREYENVLAEIKEKYKKNILEVKQECLTLKEIVQNRDALVNKLCTIISDMEVYMTKTRILKNKHNEKKVKKNTKDNDEAPLDANFYLMNIYNLTLQIDSLKETCKLYQKDIETLNGKTKVIRDQHVKTENLLKNEISKLHEQLKQKDLEFDYKVKQFHAELNKFKEENNLEQNVKDLLVNRQKVHIDGLRNELKNAKIVMQNRKLRMKLYEKLDDYMKDHETTTSHKKTRSEMPSRNGSSRFKPSQTSKNYQRRSEASSPCQQVFAKKFVSASINVIDFTL